MKLQDVKLQAKKYGGNRGYIRPTMKYF